MREVTFAGLIKCTFFYTLTHSGARAWQHTSTRYLFLFSCVLTVLHHLFTFHLIRRCSFPLVLRSLWWVLFYHSLATLMMDHPRTRFNQPFFRWRYFYKILGHSDKLAIPNCLRKARPCFEKLWRSLSHFWNELFFSSLPDSQARSISRGQTEIFSNFDIKKKFWFKFQKIWPGADALNISGLLV